MLPDGSTHLGRWIPDEKLQETLRNVGAEVSGPQITPEAAFSAVLDDNMKIELVNGWTLQRVEVAGEDRIEFTGWTDRGQYRQYAQVFTDRIDYKTRTFVPTNDAGVGTFRQMLGDHAVVSVAPKAKTADEVRVEAERQAPSTLYSEGQEGGKPFLNDVLVRRQIKAAFPALSGEEVNAAMALLYARAATWAETTNLPAEEWFDHNIDTIVRTDIAPGEGQPKASTTFTRDNKALIRGMRGATIADLMHEVGHIFQREISQGDRVALEDYLGIAPDAEWTLEASERFANGFQNYLMAGRAPVPPLQLVFNKFKTWISHIYEGRTGKKADAVTVSPELAQVFDDLLAGAAPVVEEQTQAEADIENMEVPLTKYERASKSLRKTLGNKDVYYRAILGDVKGTEVYRLDYLKGIDLGHLNREFSNNMGKLLSRKGYWKVASRLFGESGAAYWSRVGRSIPGVAKWFGIPRKDMAQLFDAAEGVLDIDADGNPIHGTEIHFKYEGGMPQLTEEGDARVEYRVSPQQSEINWNNLDEAGKDFVKWWVLERKQWHQSFQIIGEMEGYVRHYFNHDFFAGVSQMLRKRTAGARRMRKEVEGFSRDLEDAILKNFAELNHEEVQNRYLGQIMSVITEKIPPSGQLHEGWVRIPRVAEIRLGDGGKTPIIMGQLGGGRQVPKEFEEPLGIIAQGAQEATQMAQIALSTGRFFKTQLLFFPGTAAVNIVGGALQKTTKYIEYFWVGIFRGLASAFRGDMAGALRTQEPLFRELIGTMDALRPSTIANIPPTLFGTESNVRTQFGPNRNVVDRLNSVQLWHYGAIENYWKRVSAVAYLRLHGLPIDKDELMRRDEENNLVHGAAIADLGDIIDTWDYNYWNQPVKVEKFKQHPAGAFIVPFPTYMIKVTNMYGRYVRPLNPATWSTLGGEAVFARLATLGTIISMGYMAGALRWDEDDDEARVGPHAPGIPWELDRSGRVRVGSDRTRESWLRSIKYPWMQVFQAMNSAVAYVFGSRLEAANEFDQVLGDILGEGPLIKGIGLAFGYRSEYDKRKTTPQILGELARGFVPGHRLTEGFHVKGGVFTSTPTAKRYAMTFMEAFGQGLPDFIRDAVGIDEPGKLAYDKDGNVIMRDAELEAWKMWFGYNIKRIPWREYDLAAKKVVASAVKRADDATNLAQFDAAVEILETLEPRLESRREGRRPRQRERIGRRGKRDEARAVRQAEREAARRAAQARRRVAPPDQIAP